MKKMKSILIKGGLILLAVVALVAVFNPFSLNDAGNRQVIQHITGSNIMNDDGKIIGSTILEVRFQPGVYFSGFFSTVTTWPNNVTVQVGPEKNISEEADYWTLPHTGTFAGGDKATMGHTVKWDLPNTKAEMIELHTTYGSIENLMSTTLLQYQKETASYSCQRMESEAHYSGGQSQLKDYFQDQLRKGQVLLKTETKTRIQTDGTAEKYIEVEEKTDTNGVFLRTITDIQKYNLYASFVSIDLVVYDPRIKQKLKDKIDAASDESTSKQRLITAQQEEQEAIVKGRKLIAETTATEEAAEQKEVIQARKLKLVAKENLEKAKFNALATIATKKAEAEGDRLKVAAGLTPLEKAEIDKETKIGIAEALAKREVPKIVMGGSEGGGASSLNNSYTMENMIILMNKIDKIK